MRITKTNVEASKKLNMRKRANKGCDVCPCCGENKPTTHYGPFEHKGILAGPQRRGGGFFSSLMVCDLYYCKTCGAEWESDPYPDY